MTLRFPLAVALVAVTATAPVAIQAQAPNPNNPYIQSITYGGSGCPQGTVGSSFAHDRLSFTLIFDRFVASAAPGVPVTESRKNCQINVNLFVPPGSGAACATFNYRGYVQLPAGDSAEGAATYYLHGEPVDESRESFTGPVSRDYLRRDVIAVPWSATEPSVQALNINSQVRTFSLDQSQISSDSIDGKIELGACEVADTTAPAISIAAPVAGALYGLNAVVPSSYTCSDEGSGVASCAGAPALDTSAIGPKTFTVNASDVAGNTSTASATYAVGGKNECKGGGWQLFTAPTFKNQGQCVSSFVK